MSLSRMPELHRALTVAIPRRNYFPQMLEYLALSGCKFSAVDLVFQRVRCLLPAQSGCPDMRCVVWIYGKGDQTGLVFGVERPIFSRIFYEKRLFVEALTLMDRLLEEAVDHKLMLPPEKTLAISALGLDTAHHRNEKMAIHTAAMA